MNVIQKDLLKFFIGIMILICIFGPLQSDDIGLFVYIEWLEIFCISSYVAYIYGRDYFRKSSDEIIEENT